MFALIVFILILIFSVVFALGNSGIVKINLIFKSFEINQAILIVSCIIIGMIGVFIYHLYKTYKLKRELKNLRSELEDKYSIIDMLKEKLILLEKKGTSLEQNVNEKSYDLKDSNHSFIPSFLRTDKVNSAKDGTDRFKKITDKEIGTINRKNSNE